MKGASRYAGDPMPIGTRPVLMVGSSLFFLLNVCPKDIRLSAWTDGLAQTGRRSKAITVRLLDNLDVCCSCSAQASVTRFCIPLRAYARYISSTCGRLGLNHRKPEPTGWCQVAAMSLKHAECESGFWISCESPPKVHGCVIC